MGWSLLQPLGLVPHVIWAPHRGIETLAAPALACLVGLAILTWRGGRQPRLGAVLLAAFAGWWVAREGVGATDFWRVWFGIAALTAAVRFVVQGSADRLLVLSGALCGGLAVAGAGQGWLMAALVGVACGAGLVASGSTAAVPASAIAALIGAADLAGGRLLRGRLDVTDLACVGALAAPFASDIVSKRFGRLPGGVSAVVSRVIGAAAAVAAVWLLRRAFFT